MLCTWDQEESGGEGAGLLGKGFCGPVFNFIRPTGAASPPGSSINAVCGFIVRRAQPALPLKLTTWNAAGRPLGNAAGRH